MTIYFPRCLSSYLYSLPYIYLLLNIWYTPVSLTSIYTLTWVIIIPLPPPPTLHIHPILQHSLLSICFSSVHNILPFVTPLDRILYLSITNPSLFHVPPSLYTAKHLPVNPVSFYIIPYCSMYVSCSPLCFTLNKIGPQALPRLGC